MYKLFIFNNDELVWVTQDECYHVKPFIKDSELEKNYGYILNQYVYIYRGKLPKSNKVKDNKIEPGIYKNKDNEYIFIHPNSKEEKDKYSVNNIINININNILDKIKHKKDDFRSIEETEIINNNASVFKPTIKEDDDLLKQIIKKVIISKGINVKNYKDSFSSEYKLNNMKAQLVKDSPMSWLYFSQWCEVLNIGIQITAIDGGDDYITPLEKPITVEDVIYKRIKEREDKE